MRKQKYYSIDNLLKENAVYNVILGERDNGKSYAVKEYCKKIRNDCKQDICRANFID